MPQHATGPQGPVFHGSAPAHWQAGRFRLDLACPRVMGIVNLTPDSFSDGGQHAGPAAALRHCEALLAQGADVLDLGAESTRPGATPLPEADELARLLPVLRGAVGLGVPVSVDTFKPGVMAAALDLGADIVNDIWGLRQPGAEAVVAGHPSCGLCVMHMHRDPQTMQALPMDGDALPPVLAFLRERLDSLHSLGIQRDRLVVDPGIGFGKTVAQNFGLLARQAELLALGAPILAGWSRKSSLGAVTGLAVDQRLLPSVAAALLAVVQGARIVRVHDVAATRQALQVWQAMQDAA